LKPFVGIWIISGKRKKDKEQNRGRKENTATKTSSKEKISEELVVVKTTESNLRFVNEV
jgi:hypothetical protein